MLYHIKSDQPYYSHQAGGFCIDTISSEPDDDEVIDGYTLCFDNPDLPLDLIRYFKYHCVFFSSDDLEKFVRIKGYVNEE